MLPVCIYQSSPDLPGIDDCVGITCGNNGTCVDGHKNYSCQCELGWIGVNCSTSKHTQPFPTPTHLPMTVLVCVNFKTS